MEVNPATSDCTKDKTTRRLAPGKGNAARAAGAVGAIRAFKP